MYNEACRELLKLSQNLGYLLNYYNEEPLDYPSKTLKHEIYKFYTAFSDEVPTEGIPELCKGLLNHATLFVASLTAKHYSSPYLVKESFHKVLGEFIEQLRRLIDTIAAGETQALTAQLVRVTIEYMERAEIFTTENKVKGKQELLKTAIDKCLEQLQSAYFDLRDEECHSFPEYSTALRCIERQIIYWTSLKDFVQETPLSEDQSSALLEYAPLVNDETDFMSTVVSAKQFIGCDPEDVTRAELESVQRRFQTLASYYEVIANSQLPSLNLNE